jgi:hypothetical protein
VRFGFIATEKGLLSGGADLPGAASLARRLLAWQKRPVAERTRQDQRLVLEVSAIQHREPRPLRQSTGPCGIA